MACCANTFRRGPTYPAGTQTTSRRSPTPSTPDPARPSAGEPLRKPSPNTYTRFTKPVLRPPIESALRSSIRMVHNIVQVKHAFMLAGPDRLLDPIEHHRGRHRRRRPPAQNPPRVSIDDEGHVGESRPGRHVGQVSHPQPVGCRRGELSLHEISRTRGHRVGDRGALDLPRMAPASPSSAISRSTVQRATSMPSRLSANHTLRAPYTP